MDARDLETQFLAGKLNDAPRCVLILKAWGKVDGQVDVLNGKRFLGGLKVKDELVAAVEACARQDFILEPTGGITPENFREIVEIALNAGVKQVIPHVYSSIIDKQTDCTKIDEVKSLLSIVKQVA